MGEWIIGITVIAVLFLTTIIMILRRYRKCPSDKILVIYGKVGEDRSAKCIHGGASFIWPVIQSYQFLDLTPMSIEVNLTNALSRQNIRIDVPSRFTVGISTEEGIMQNAAERLLGLNLKEIQELAKDIIFGQLRLVVATMDIEEINTDRDKFLAAVSSNVETELKKIGLRLINVNVTDINDESGYIEALGKEASAKAINDARKSVAERDRDGATGEANANQEKRINVARANSIAVQGENEAKVTIAESEALRREKVAEAERRAAGRREGAAGKGDGGSLSGAAEAENCRARLEQATREADEIVKAEIDKRTVEIAAEAEPRGYAPKRAGRAERDIREDEAQARVLRSCLGKQAEVSAASWPRRRLTPQTSASHHRRQDEDLVRGRSSHQES